MTHLLLYLLVLSACAPGVIALMRFPELGRFPILVFTFIGFVIFDAIGTYTVLSVLDIKGLVERTQDSYIIMLVMYIAIFYAVAIPYIYMRLRHPVQRSLVERPGDMTMKWMLVIAMLIGMTLYYRAAGGFLLLDMLQGHITFSNVLQYRQATYYLSGFTFYRIGLIVLPMILGVHVLLLCLYRDRWRSMDIVLLVSGLMPGILMGEKSGVLNSALMYVVTYVVYLGLTRQSLRRVFSIRVIGFLGAGLGVSLLIYLKYGWGVVPLSEVLEVLSYRIIGVYSEAWATVIPLVQDHGLYGGMTLPTVQGLFPHKQIVLDAAMHEYMNGAVGSAPVPAIAEGYANFGWPGFFLFAIISSVIAVIWQEIFLRLRLGIFGFTLTCWWAYLALNMALISLFATLVSLIYTAVLGLLIMIRAGVGVMTREWIVVTPRSKDVLVKTV